MRRTRRTAGMTMLELSIATGILATLVLGTSRLLGTTSSMTSRSRADLAAFEANRAALERLAGLLRGASGDSLTGFDVNGVATVPLYRTVTGMTSGTPVLSAIAKLEWRETTPAVQGVARPGEVVLVQSGVTSRVAARVPFGGFTVTQAGAALKIHIESFAPTGTGETSRVSGDTLVCLRN